MFISQGSPNARLKKLALIGAISLMACSDHAADFQITKLATNGIVTWTNAPSPAVGTVETSSVLNSLWLPAKNVFSTNAVGSAQISVGSGNRFVRLRAVDVSATPEGFTNLVQSYGLLETVAGNGAGQTDGVSYWQSFYEGQNGYDAALSRPHFAMADRAGNVFIADKNSHSILKVDTAGKISTYAGTHVGGFNGEGPAAATSLQLNFPNSLWVRDDGVVYVLDTDNGRVRRISTNGIMTTLFLAVSNGSALGGGRGLWVKDDESLAYFCNSTRVRKWTPGEGVSTFVNNFKELGDLYVETNGDVLVCDRGDNKVFRFSPTGTKTNVAGNGNNSGGGDGSPGLDTGLEGVRGVWPVPTGGLLLLTHDSSRLWYMDTAGIIHLLLEGAGGRTHSGDGFYFYNLQEPKISEGRSVSMDYDGNIIVCESDYGYVRRIRFERLFAP